MSEAEKENVLQNYRLAFRADTMVNWCPGLGTVLANDEVKDGCRCAAASRWSKSE